MPNIKVWGLAAPNNTHWGVSERSRSDDFRYLADLRRLRDNMVKAMLEIKELDLGSGKEVNCLFPEDTVREMYSRQILIEVTLFAEPERTDEVRRRLAEALVGEVEGWWRSAGLRKPELIECFVHLFDQRQGYSSLSKEG